MGRIKRYASALRRLKRAHGHGVHSPFAFEYVTSVLSPHYAYYAYRELEKARNAAKRLSGEPVASLKDAQTIFRIAVKAGAREMVQVGGRSGLLTTALALTDSRSRVTVIGPESECWREVTAPLSRQIASAETLPPGTKPQLALLCECYDQQGAERLVSGVLSREGVVIFKGLDRNRDLRAVWTAATGAMERGMTFTNYKTGVAVGLERLPRQNFILWF